MTMQKSLSALMLGAVLLGPGYALAEEPQVEDISAKVLGEFPYYDNVDGGRFVVYSITADADGNWSLDSEFMARGMDGEYHRGGFHMAEGTDLMISDQADHPVLASLTAQCRAEFDAEINDVAEDSTYYVGQSTVDENRIRVVIRTDDENWRTFSLLKTPNSASRCIEGHVEEKPDVVEMIPGTKIPMPSGPSRGA